MALLGSRIGSGGASDLGGLSDVTLSAPSSGQLMAYNGSQWVNVDASTVASGDRIVSGTTAAVIANQNTGYVSLTYNSGTAAWGYLGASSTYLPNLSSNLVSSTRVSVSTISATIMQVASPSTAQTCDSGTSGGLRYNSAGNYMELCNSTGWQPMGVGVPAGTISAFASTTCPTGWSEYTAARGRFLRGIDNGAGNDPDGTRAPGATQTDAFQGHMHKFGGTGSRGTGEGVPLSNGANASYILPWPASGGLAQSDYWALDSDGTNGTPRTANETRPKNVAVTWCQFQGTTHGWNNPLSGGGTVPGGSTGQIQYNTAGVLDASANLTWDNAASKLTATNVSVTALTVNGVAVGGVPDRIVSGTASVIVNATGLISASGPVSLAGTGSETCTADLRGTVRQNPITKKLEVCRF